MKKMVEVKQVKGSERKKQMLGEEIKTRQEVECFLSAIKVRFTFWIIC